MSIIRELPEEDLEEQIAAAQAADDAVIEDDPEPEQIEFDEESAAFIHDLVLRCVAVTEDFTDYEFYPYQREAAYRIWESVIIGDGEEVTLLQARQSGKSEVLADVIATMMVFLPRLAKAYPSLLGKFAKGFLVGCFAPTDEQADTVWGRIVDRLTSVKATEYMLDPEIDERVTKEGGKSRAIKLKNSGSLCRRQTCNPRAKIESKTYHFVLIDEAQEADAYVVEKSISPMLASTNGTTVMTGSASRTKGIFYRAIQHNKRRQTKKGQRQNHFEYDYRFVCKYNPNYRKYVAKEKARRGEDSDEFQMSYCVAPDTRILTADLQHVRAGDIVTGMKLVGFDEDRPGTGMHRQFKETDVLDVGRIVRPCYRIALSDGTVVVSSSEHRWLVSTAGRRTLWKSTEELTSSDRIFKVTDVWSEDRTYEGGYLAAALDGEGHLLNGKPGQMQLVFSQRENAMLEKVRKCLAEKGYQSWERSGGGTHGDVNTLCIGGGRAETIRFLGEMHPVRLLDKFHVDQLGSIGRHDRRTGGFDHPAVTSLEYVGEQEVIAIKTTTKTYVAEGLASHNCCKWLLDQGMYVTEERFVKLGDPSMRTYRSWFKGQGVVVGIDPARTKDSTVVTVVWVDWDRPDAFGYYEHRILNWLEIHNKEWEHQYYEIVEFLSNYKILRIGVDTTGMGSAVYDRIRVLFPDVQVIECPSDSKTQSLRWKHLMAIIERQALVFPAHSVVKRSRSWKRFFQQMIDLETKMQGPYLLAAAPDEAEAHDDYPDSLAIACSMTLEDTMQEVEVVDSPFVSRRR